MRRFFRIIFLFSAWLVFLWGCSQPQEAWYPDYSTYWASEKTKSQLVIIHGFGGDMETFNEVPLNLVFQESRGLYYFTYDSGVWEENSHHISRVASDFRSFLENNIFRHNPNAKIDIVAHSTGGLIAREYIANNLLSHRVKKLVLVGVPNYGAYWVGSLQAISRDGILTGDILTKELQHGSHSLFELQKRWDCMYKLYQKQEEKFKPSFKEAKDILEHWSLLPNCVLHNRLISKDSVSLNPVWVEFPEILVVMGTSYWDDAWAFRFSDGVVRLESGVLDERFLYPMQDPKKQKRGFIYVEHNHTGIDGYFGENGKKEIFHIIATFLQYKNHRPLLKNLKKTQKKDGEVCSQENYKDLWECYKATIGTKAKDINVSAYWVQVTDLGPNCLGELNEHDVDVDIKIDKLKIDSPLLEISNSASKERFSKDSWIEYQRYVKADKKPYLANVKIKVTPQEDTNLKPIEFESPITLTPGRTTMLYCWVSEGKCLDITSRYKKGENNVTSSTAGQPVDYPNKKKAVRIENKCKNEGLFKKRPLQKGVLERQLGDNKGIRMMQYEVV